MIRRCVVNRRSCGGRWRQEFDELMLRVGGRFARVGPQTTDGGVRPRPAGRAAQGGRCGSAAEQGERFGDVGVVPGREVLRGERDVVVRRDADAVDELVVGAEFLWPEG
jgi:hypothetical protein